MTRRTSEVPAAAGTERRRFLPLAEAVIHHLEQLAEREEVLSPEDVVRALEVALPRTARLSRWADRIGPVFTIGQL